MGHTNTYIKGEWNAVCDSCGLEFKASKLKKRWNGMMVCKADWEPRHPQEFVRGVPDLTAPPWVRPDSEEDAIVSLTGTATLASGTQSVSAVITATTVVTLPDTADYVLGGGIVFFLSDTSTTNAITFAAAGADSVITNFTQIPYNVPFRIIRTGTTTWTVG